MSSLTLIPGWLFSNSDMAWLEFTQSHSVIVTGFWAVPVFPLAEERDLPPHPAASSATAHSAAAIRPGARSGRHTADRCVLIIFAPRSALVASSGGPGIRRSGDPEVRGSGDP